MINHNGEVLVIKFVLLLMPLVFVSLQSFADDAQPRVGRDAAAKYFQRSDSSSSSNSGGGGGGGLSSSTAHYLALQVGTYMNSQSYDWGKNGQENDVGNYFFGVTYRVGEWVNSMDLDIRIDYDSYKVGGDQTSQLTFMPVIMFPDAPSKFPLYFGAGAGPGVFLKQTGNKSPLSIDYQIMLGARFFDVFENAGFFIEAGLKNFLLLTSSGQLNGTFISTGMVFTF